jgi:hypothetical protein
MAKKTPANDDLIDITKPSKKVGRPPNAVKVANATKKKRKLKKEEKMENEDLGDLGTEGDIDSSLLDEGVDPFLNDDAIKQIEESDTPGVDLFTLQNLQMKTEMHEPLIVVCTQALIEAEDWHIPELKNAAEQIMAMRVSLKREGRKEGVDIVKADSARDMMPMMPGMPNMFAQQNPNPNNAPPAQKKGVLDRFRSA